MPRYREGQAYRAITKWRSVCESFAEDFCLEHIASGRSGWPDNLILWVGEFRCGSDGAGVAISRTKREGAAAAGLPIHSTWVDVTVDGSNDFREYLIKYSSTDIGMFGTYRASSLRQLRSQWGKAQTGGNVVKLHDLLRHSSSTRILTIRVSTELGSVGTDASNLTVVVSS